MLWLIKTILEVVSGVFADHDRGDVEYGDGYDEGKDTNDKQGCCGGVCGGFLR